MIWAVAFVLLVALLLLSIPVAATMAGLGLILGKVFTPFPLYRSLGEISWEGSTNFTLFAIPLFVLLGQFLVHSGIADRTYKAVDTWLCGLPGGLMHANVATCALFAATSGSSVATAATMGTVAMPQAKKFGYHDGLFAASIASGGTLGILIPPSINMIVYGFMTNTSIPKLFVAGIVPGVILTVLFMLFILGACVVKPELGGVRRRTSWRERVHCLKDLLPVGIIFSVVIGSVYTGFATPTESAALGVLAAFFIALWYRRISWQILVDSMKGTMKTTGMIMLILLAANFLNFILVFLGLSQQITQLVGSLGMTPFATLMLIIAMYVVLGFFIETLSLMVLTIPVVHPIIQSLGYDPIWFGILLILLIQMALITPPVGLNLYVIQGVRQRGSISDLAVWIIPFVAMLFVMIALLIRYPGLALWLVG